MHLVTEGRINPGGCSYGQLQSWLVTIPGRLGMERISPAIVEWRPPILAGMVLLAESHVSVHVDFGRGRFYADAFTCKAFEPQAFCKELMGLNLTVERAEVLNRGLEYLPFDAAQDKTVAPP